MRKKLPTVAIAVCAFNEEVNILNFLTSVVKQKEMGFKITRILVIDDGSSDKTVERVKRINDKRVSVIQSTQRVGKSVHLNEIYQDLFEDYLVQSDADVVFSHDYVVHDMVLPLMKDGTVGMCGGNPLPFKARGFVEQSINCTVDVYIKLRRKVRKGNNIFSVDGRLLSYRKELVKKITVPSDMIANDAFTYFTCLVNNFSYKFVKNAVVNFRSPQTISDQIRQNTRFRAAPIRMKKYFPPELVVREYEIDKRLLLLLYLVTFIKYPIHCTFIYILNIYTKILANKREAHLNAKWDMAVTTKKVSYA